MIRDDNTKLDECREHALLLGLRTYRPVKLLCKKHTTHSPFVLVMTVGVQTACSSSV